LPQAWRLLRKSLALYDVSVIDPQNGSVPNAQISIRAKNSQWAQLAKTNSDGIAVIQAVPIGDYIVSVSAEGFTTATDKAIQVTSDKVTPPFHAGPWISTGSTTEREMQSTMRSSEIPVCFCL
jgi:Carboxypeptidase regulatory-like domain